MSTPLTGVQADSIVRSALNLRGIFKDDQSVVWCLIYDFCDDRIGKCRFAEPVPPDTSMFRRDVTACRIILPGQTSSLGLLHRHRA